MVAAEFQLSRSLPRQKSAENLTRSISYLISVLMPLPKGLVMHFRSTEARKGAFLSALVVAILAITTVSLFAGLGERAQVASSIHVVADLLYRL